MMAEELWVIMKFLPHPMNLPLFCFQGRCSRENCKYLHPPPHLKTQLEINGRNNLIQQKNMAMLAQQMQIASAIMPGSQLQPMVRKSSYSACDASLPVNYEQHHNQETKSNNKNIYQR